MTCPTCGSPTDTPALAFLHERWWFHADVLNCEQVDVKAEIATTMQAYADQCLAATQQLQREEREEAQKWLREKDEALAAERERVRGVLMERMKWCNVVSEDPTEISNWKAFIRGIATDLGINLGK